MILVKPSHHIITEIDQVEIMRRIETAGRTCYKSEAKISESSSDAFVRKIVRNGHHSVLEHEAISVRFVCDRGVSHELVRHRLAAFSQESTRYCDYSGGVAFVIPPWVNLPEGMYRAVPDIFMLQPSRSWFKGMLAAESLYAELICDGWSPQQARSVLPNSTKTEIVMTANIREWRHVLQLRTSSAAHPQMVEVMIPLLMELKEELPALFGDI
jgi:thymidylate synthase (FAD)